jgi:L-lactate permease
MKIQRHQDPKIAWVAACLPILAFLLKPLLQGRIAAAVALASGVALLAAVAYLVSNRPRQSAGMDHGQVS